MKSGQRFKGPDNSFSITSTSQVGIDLIFVDRPLIPINRGGYRPNRPALILEETTRILVEWSGALISQRQFYGIPDLFLLLKHVSGGNPEFPGINRAPNLSSCFISKDSVFRYDIPKIQTLEDPASFTLNFFQPVFIKCHFKSLRTHFAIRAIVSRLSEKC